MQLFDFDIMLRQIYQENMYQTLSELASFCKRYDKNILVCFSVQSSNCCSLANANAKFHKVE